MRCRWQANHLAWKYSPEAYGLPDITGELRRLLEDGRQEEYFADLDIICRELAKSSSWHDNRAIECYYSAAVAVIAFINQKKFAGKVAFRIGPERAFSSSDGWLMETGFGISL